VLAKYPNETVAIDILGPFPRSDNGNMWILTMIDTFTRWPVAVPMPDRTSASVAEAIYKHWICEKSVPAKIVSDRAREFVATGMKQLAERLGTSLVTTGGYNPTGNSSVERFHRYFNAALTTIMDRAKVNWDDYVPAVLFSYRASVCETTGYSPFFLETGRQPALPIDNLFAFLRKGTETVEDFVTAITGRLKNSFERVRVLQAMASERNKDRQKMQSEPTFKPGDHVLLFARSAKEGRLEVKGEDGEAISLPTKLRNAFIGPYKMVRYVGPRKCVILVKGKEMVYNVNRLIQHYPWDDEHLTTSERAVVQPIVRPKLSEPAVVGDIVVFPLGQGLLQAAPFGVGRLMAIRGEFSIKVQWWGNAECAKASGTFRPAWWRKRDNCSYYAVKRSLVAWRMDQ
jgi:transposase InsO family protein